jgi:hypothetical protein
VVERPDPEHRQAAAQPRLEGQEVGRHLRGGVRAGRPERRVLGEGQLVLLDPAVHVGAADGEHAVHADLGGGEEHVERALGVGPERLDRRPPAATHVGPAGQVVDDVGPGLTHQRHEGVAVGDVDAAGGPVARDHLVTLGFQVVAEVAPDEAAGPRDERPHGRPRRVEVTGRGLRVRGSPSSTAKV